MQSSMLATYSSTWIHCPVEKSGSPFTSPWYDSSDIGPKFGNGAYNSMDNGLLMFDNVHIPRDQMLMRVLQVMRGGKVVKFEGPQQLSYGQWFM